MVKSKFLVFLIPKYRVVQIPVKYVMSSFDEKLERRGGNKKRGNKKFVILIEIGTLSKTAFSGSS